jgi:hypothetical protein
MYCGQTGPLSGVIEASQLVMPQGEVPVTPFHIGPAGAFEQKVTVLNEGVGSPCEIQPAT